MLKKFEKLAASKGIAARTFSSPSGLLIMAECLTSGKIIAVFDGLTPATNYAEFLERIPDAIPGQINARAEAIANTVLEW